MKCTKKIITVTLSALLAVGMVSTAYAEEAPHLLYGTERTYGEDKTQHGALYQGTEEDDYATVGPQYAILPKTDTFSFEKDNSNINTLHNVVVEWWCPKPYQENDKVALFWEGAPVKKEKFEFGKEYSVYPEEVQESVALLSTPNAFGEAYYKTMNANEPFVILTVTDYDLNYQWWWTYQVIDNWNAPGGSVDTSTLNGSGQTGSWMNDSKGWWIQNTDGTYLVNAWYQAPSTGLWYYMGVDGYMLTNTTTPDGCTVNGDGVWVQ